MKNMKLYTLTAIAGLTLGSIGVATVASADADHGEVEATGSGEFVERRQELGLAQVAHEPEQHQRIGSFAAHRCLFGVRRVHGR